MRLDRKLIGKTLGPASFIILFFFLPLDGLSEEGRAVLATTAWVGIWWMTEAIPIEATALLPMVLFPLTGAVDMRSTTFPYAHPLIFLFLGGFMIAIAIEKWNLHKRIALNIISLLGSNPSQLILGFMIATGFLSMWISNTATTLMMIPIGLSVIANLDENKNFAKALPLAIAYSASIGGMATLIGTPPNIVFAGIVKDTFGVEVNFMEWMIIGLPFSILMIGITWLVITKYAFKISPDMNLSNAGINERLAELGKMSAEEKRVLAVFSFTAICWMSRTYLLNPILPGLNDTTIGVFGGLCLFLIPNTEGGKLLNWQLMSKVPWGILVLYGGGLSIANAVAKTDLAAWIGALLNTWGNLELVLLISLIVAAVNFMTEITSNIATASMVLPILAALAISIDTHPYYLMVGAILAASCAFMLPVATAPNAIAFSAGTVKMKDMIKVGILLNILSILLITLIVYVIMPIVWTLDISLFLSSLK
ncbi:solute carrier family 13 (sodium-dependent dicarboxylate transporter), member 2/3/5 [Reichenbachiella faecimaris]|uniref:Solute carrier family 13 (Sodium-dependent dicarboxylate transporter), member 2/3/5 n=1 Tax=Reichenbachiella faecimaris TaxID=692418 RepID=A0A1W2GBF3_REIFA|nr:SLC13 family permease [Reichenbachiella faecimaris]SMD33987.1 solute carrier family 13 (sodium-dependent dicarboxylate transporter), member 2/3/5 [Reichenbachiella faecimaris]